MVIYWWRYRRAARRGELPPATDIMDKETTAPIKTRGEITGEDAITPPSESGTEGHDGASKSEGRNFTLFIYALLLAYVAVLVRCIYR